MDKLCIEFRLRADNKARFKNATVGSGLKVRPLTYSVLCASNCSNIAHNVQTELLCLLQYTSVVHILPCRIPMDQMAFG